MSVSASYLCYLSCTGCLTHADENAPGENAPAAGLYLLAYMYTLQALTPSAAELARESGYFALPSQESPS